MQTDVHTLVVKVGTSLLTGPKGFDGRVMESVVKEIATLKKTREINVLIVSSGAVGCGMTLLGLTQRPKSIPLKQATAAVGQSRLMHFYETLFQTHGQGLQSAQVLLTTPDLDDRQRYLNIRNTVKTLFELKTVVPILNENDSVSTAELRFGDNDTLAAKVAAKIDADLLIILSDVDGLYDKNPARHKNAKLVEVVDHVTDEIEALAEGAAGESSVGGMHTKLSAAKIAGAAGLPMVITNGRRSNVIHDVLAGTARCTRFGANHSGISQRKRWIAFGRHVRGVLDVDDGARSALLTKGRSLLPAGVTAVSGSFEVGDSVRVRDTSGHEIACGLVNYSSGDIARIKGLKSAQIKAILGHKDFDEVIHRDNLVII
ncbi:MAG: glutamate 5-kinase [Candidatus Hydrogenedentes bacterium]|nr:glutamate 5-kinase [Candidatus Hydrogenedentota bacterium]